MLRLLPFVALLGLAACRTEPATPEASGADAPVAEAPADEAATPDAALPEADNDVPAAEDGTVDLDAYALSMDRITRWARATARLADLTDSDPALARKWETDGVDPNSYPDMLARVTDESRAVAAVREAGMTPEAYIAAGVVYLRSASASLDPGAGFSGLPGVTDANVAFVTENRLAIDSILVTTLQR